LLSGRVFFTRAGTLENAIEDAAGVLIPAAARCKQEECRPFRAALRSEQIAFVALAYLSMILSENRCTLFRIML